MINKSTKKKLAPPKTLREALERHKGIIKGHEHMDAVELLRKYSRG